MSPEIRLRQIARWTRWPLHRLFWRLILSCALVVVFAMLMVRGIAEDPHKNEIKSRAAILAFRPPGVPDSDNAALVYRKAFAAFVSYSKVKSTLPPSSPEPENPELLLGRSSEELKQAHVQAYLNANTQCLALVEAAAKMPRCDWKTDLTNLSAVSSTPFSELRTGSRLLLLRARIRAHAGDHSGAAQDFQYI